MPRPYALQANEFLSATRTVLEEERQGALAALAAAAAEVHELTAVREQTQTLNFAHQQVLLLPTSDSTCGPITGSTQVISDLCIEKDRAAQFEAEADRQKQACAYQACP
jgi:hypothetical protein